MNIFEISILIFINYESIYIHELIIKLINGHMYISTS